MPAVLPRQSMPARPARRAGAWQSLSADAGARVHDRVAAWPAAGAASTPDGTADRVWRLPRNCAISPRQLMLALAAAAGVSLLIGLAMWVAGAPWVLPFAGVELAALATALVIHARHTGDHDLIVLSGLNLRVERQRGSRVQVLEFNPRWVRVEPRSVQGSLVRLSGQGQHVDIGQFVRPGLRQQLASELRDALRCPGAAARE